MKNFTKFLAILFMLILIPLSGCLNNPPSNPPADISYDIKYQKENCNLSINNSTNLLQAKENSILTIQHNPQSDNYVFEKLVYLKGEYQSGQFIPNSEEITIYNNKLLMPDSDIKIICKYKQKSHKLTIKNVYFSTDSWKYNVYELSSLAVKINHEYYYNNENLNSNLSLGQHPTWELTDDKTVYNKDYADIQLGMYVALKINTTDTYQAINPQYNINYINCSSTGILTVSGKTGYARITEEMVLDLVYVPTLEPLTEYVDCSVEVFFDYETDCSIQFISSSGNCYNNLICKTGEKISNPSSSIWYTDKNCTQEYNFSSEVLEDLVLYQ